ncbi:MAG: DUF2510 domain-containing protein [Acidimicrobiales bacterium]
MFALGWAQAVRFRAQHRKSAWGISPLGWGVVCILLPFLGLAVFFAASRTTRTADPSLVHRSGVVVADTAEEREKITKLQSELPLLRPPHPATRDWHPDPLHQKAFRFFDGKNWTREVVDDPRRRKAEMVGDLKADLRRRLKALPRPADTTPSWHVDPLGENHYRYFDGEVWTEQVRQSRVD